MIGFARTATRRPVMLVAAVGIAAAMAYAVSVPPPATHTAGNHPTVVTDEGRTLSKDKLAVGEVGRSDSLGGDVAAPATVSATQGITAEKVDSSMAEDTLSDSDTASALKAIPVDAKIIQNGSMTIVVKHGKLVAMFNKASTLATGFGGYISNSQMQQDATSEIRSGSLTLRIPSDRYTQALNSLSSLGKVSSRQTSSSDVSEEYVDTASRLRHDQAVEGRLLSLLAKAKTINETLAIQTRLDTVEEQIEIEKGRIRYLDKMTSFSTIDLTLTEKGGPAVTPKAKGDTWGFSTAWKNAAHRFVGNTNRAIVAIGGFLPALLTLTIAGIAFRIVRRKRAGVRQVDAVDTIK